MTRNINNNLTPGKLFKYIGVVLILLGGLALWILVNNSIISIDIFSVMSIPVSFGIALFAIGISLESDEKMKIVENLNLQRLIDEFLDRRLTLHERLLSINKTVVYAEKQGLEEGNKLLLYKGKNDFEIYYIFSIWICLRYLRKINKLKDRLNSDQQRTIIKGVSILFDDLKWGLDFLITKCDKNYKIPVEYENQIKQIYDIVVKFDEYQNSKYRRNIECWKMSERKVEEKEEKPYPITIPDWITYLTSMSSNAMSLSVVIVSIFAVMVLAFIGFYSPGIFGFFPTLSLMAVAGFLFYFLLDNVGRRSSKYQKLLKKIMNGEIPNPIGIRKKYKEIGEELEKKWWKINKDR